MSSSQSQILPADRAAALPTSGGVSARLVDDSQNGVAAGLLASAPADGSRLMSVGLFIDVNSQALNVAGVTKQITLCFGGGCNGGGGGGGGCARIKFARLAPSSLCLNISHLALLPLC